MSSMRTFSPRDLLTAVQKIKVCLYDTSNAQTVIPEGEGFYINQAGTILGTILADLNTKQTAVSGGGSKLDEIFHKLNAVDHSLFGTAGIAVENPALQDVILKSDSIYEKLYKREGSMCTIS